MKLLWIISLLLIYTGMDINREAKKQPMPGSMPEIERKARTALVNYIKDVVLNREKSEGEKIRLAVLDYREPVEREEAEKEMLEQAEAFPEIINENSQLQPWLLENSINPDN